MEFSWLGETWCIEYNNGQNPTLNQIEKGLVAEAMVQIHLAMGKIEEQRYVLSAKANIKKTWKDLLAKANIQDRDAVLTYDELDNPYHGVTTVCLYIY